ncbi:hypothetical protein ACFPOI_05200 [Nonomuraea angiospora]|uniref:Uncharacterized protein n=1 Tax=Nonomuraea angiospora TaxID=46172 RepID=A0ABR9MCU8_9ACTN|nr:hypothetical protein [Nonomuraea angiospora]MBE1590410.1 hypothetical protein [Nonomuraea angiospora]
MPQTRRAGAACALLGLVLGALALGPGLRWGFVLVQDMVFVPEPRFSRFTFGLAGGAPRVVPSDAVVTALASVVPAELVQKAVLLGVFALGCAGAGLLVPSAALGPRLVAGAFYVWNPYVAERLLMGQWALLLGYAGLPWVVRAACAPRRVAVAMVPAAVGGFAAMAVTAITVLPSAWYARGRSLLPAAGVVLAFSLPWLVPALARPEALNGDGVGVDAFAARADGPFGAVVSLLSLGGIWNAGAVPAGYDAPIAALARLVLVLAGIAAVARARDLPGRAGLAVAAAAGFAIACIGVTAAGRAALRWLVELWGGFGVLRDAQQFVAPLALLAAVGLGLLAARAAAEGGRLVPYGVSLLVLAPIAVLPTLAWGAFGRLEAVEYPRSWYEARAAILADGAPGDVLVLPFESYRRFAWNGGRAVLDPAQRFFAAPGRDVVANDSVRVGSMVVAAEDRRVREVERVLDGSSPDLAAAGFRYVVVDAGTVEERARFDRWTRGAALVVDRPELRLYRFQALTDPL